MPKSLYTKQPLASQVPSPATSAESPPSSSSVSSASAPSGSTAPNPSAPVAIVAPRPSQRSSESSARVPLKRKFGVASKPKCYFAFCNLLIAPQTLMTKMRFAWQTCVVAEPEPTIANAWLQVAKRPTKTPHLPKVPPRKRFGNLRVNRLNERLIVVVLIADSHLLHLLQCQ